MSPEQLSYTKYNFHKLNDFNQQMFCKKKKYLMDESLSGRVHFSRKNVKSLLPTLD